MDHSVELAEVSVRSSPDFGAWTAARGPAVLRFAYALTGNAADAEDLAQEALVKVLARWDRIGEIDHVEAYVRRVMVNTHTSWWRRWRRRELPMEHLEVEAANDDQADLNDEHRQVWLACRALPIDQRTALVLRYYEQLEYAEIAALTGVREGTVRSRVSRALASLRSGSALEDENESL